jgi:glycine oxidase
LQRVAIVGCGVVGAAIAYELSQTPGFEVLVLDQTSPATASTGAALGILMAIISHKVKGRNWRLRHQSWQRYQTLIPELEALTGQWIQRNSQGLLNLCFDGEALPRWQSLQAIRKQQGHTLDIWDPGQVSQACPHVQTANVVAGIFSPQDFQVNPVSLTRVLVQAAAANGVDFSFNQPVVDLLTTGDGADHRCTGVVTPAGPLPVDCLVLASGLGTTPLTQRLGAPTAIGPVLGQGLEVQLAAPLGSPNFEPVVNGDDIHLVPLGGGRYWVGATVEFPPDTTTDEVLELQPEAERLEQVWQRAISFCPTLAQGNITRRWFGLRPRPQGQAAPVIQPVAGYTNVWLATGHYRNGVLLAPATALAVKQQLIAFQLGASWSRE